MRGYYDRSYDHLRVSREVVAAAAARARGDVRPDPPVLRPGMRVRMDTQNGPVFGVVIWAFVLPPYGDVRVRWDSEDTSVNIEAARLQREE